MNWYEWHAVTERLQGRAYALTRGRPYKVILDPRTSTGTCDFTNKRILINPNLFSDVLQKMGLTGTSLDKANFLISRAVTGHESLHVLYSDPQAVAAAESPVVKIILNILEDARIEKIGAQTSHVSKTLFRFLNGIAANQLTPFSDTEIKDTHSWINLLLRWRLGAEIPKLDEDASTLWSQAQVLANKALYAPDCGQVLDIAREIVRLLGLDTCDKTMSENVSELLGKMQSNMTGSRGNPSLPNPISEDFTEENLSPIDGDEDSASTPPDKPATGSKNSTNPDQETEPESSAAPSLDEMEKLIDKTAQDLSEDLESLVPKDNDANPMVAKAIPWRGRIYPNISASPYMHYLPAAVPIAAEIVRELKTQSPRAICGPSESSGKFKTRYFIRDSAKPYAAERFQGLATPKMALSLIIDRSGSMESVQEELRIMSISISMACEQLGIALSIWALEGQVHIKGFDEHGPQVLAKLAGIEAGTLTRVMPTIRDVVADIWSRPEPLKQIVMIHDGMPNDRVDFMNWKKLLRGIGFFCLYIMPEEEYQCYKDCPGPLRENMDGLVGPKDYAVAPVTSIAKHWCSYIKNIRNRNATPIH